jgi:ketol-acid reductoisomerase
MMCPSILFHKLRFTRWIAENKNGRTFFNAKRAQLAKHQMETVGAELRKNMLWGDDIDPDTASN